jgi:hypothetical protein
MIQMTRSNLISFLSNDPDAFGRPKGTVAFNIPPGTVAERAKALSAAGMLSVGKQGPHGLGARMSIRDAVNLTLACMLEHQRNESVAENVKRVRDLRSDGKPSSSPPGFVPDLPFFTADTAGAAIESLWDSAGTGHIIRWANRERLGFNVTVESRGESVVLDLTHKHIVAVCEFGERRLHSVERETRITFGFIMRLASALGLPPG